MALTVDDEIASDAVDFGSSVVEYGGLIVKFLFCPLLSKQKHPLVRL